MKGKINIATLQNFVFTTLKAIFNMEKQAISVVCVQVQANNPKSPYHFVRKK